MKYDPKPVPLPSRLCFVFVCQSDLWQDYAKTRGGISTEVWVSGEALNLAEDPGILFPTQVIQSTWLSHKLDSDGQVHRLMSERQVHTRRREYTYIWK